MPRKASKKQKPPLIFLERAVCGARLQNVPEVREAVNPKEFFTDTHETNASTLSSWVSPQFDASAAAAPLVRRGRRKAQTTTSILETCSQLSRKSSVCKFPSLSFKTRSGDQPHRPKRAHAKRAASDVGKRAEGPCPNEGTASSAQYSDTPKRQMPTVRKRTEKRHPAAATSSSRLSDQSETPSDRVTERCQIPADGGSTPASGSFLAAEVSVGPAPDVDTPKEIQDRSSPPPSSALLLLLLPQSCTPPCNQPPDILVADTPERDYGLKVTWRRRKGLMSSLKARGLLSDSDVLIQS